jgi:hypothetical protein
MATTPDHHPDAALLALCSRLAGMQAEWQRLHAATSDDGPWTEADEAWLRYASTTWPGVGPERPEHQGEDVPGQLLLHRAATPEGMAAKASAILALDDAAGYTRDCRDDHCALVPSLLEDVAGAQYRPIGDA